MTRIPITMQTQTQPTPIPIEHGIMVPWRTCGGFDTTAERLRRTIANMKPLDSFKLKKLMQYRQAYRCAQQVGAVIIGRKIPQGGWRVWRLG